MAVVAPKLDRTVPLKIHRDPIIVLNARWQPEIFLGDISMHAVLIAAPIHVLSVAETTSSVARVPPGLVLERRICAVRHKVVPISARLLCYLRASERALQFGKERCDRNGYNKSIIPIGVVLMLSGTSSGTAALRTSSFEALDCRLTSALPCSPFWDGRLSAVSTAMAPAFVDDLRRVALDARLSPRGK
eukprot:4723267-Prymnesium_polylepis.2